MEVRGQRSPLPVSLLYSQPSVLNGGLTLNLELIRLARVSGWLRSFSDPTVLGLEMSAGMASFSVGDGNTNSVPHAPVAD